MRARKLALMEELLPKIEVKLPEDGRLDLGGLFKKQNPCHSREGGSPICFSPQEPNEMPACAGMTEEGEKQQITTFWLEIGFGGGEHLAAQAAANPAIGMIGCEPFINGVASLLGHVEAQALANVRLYPGDARLLLDALPDACLEKVFVLFADPWPKKRHHERRFIGPENLPRLARVLKAGGELRLATDVMPLGEWMREHTNAHPDFTCVYDGFTPPADWVATRYEQKGRAAGREPVYLIFKRKA